MRLLAGMAALALAGACLHAADSPAYTGSAQCAGCHSKIAATYRLTGMGRAFTRATTPLPGLDARGSATFYHEASRRWYTIAQRDGAAYVKRYQLGWQGAQTNVLEARADYVIGSGNHAVGLAHRAADGRLLQLPVAWYSESGKWGMAPGYDRANHAGFRRGIDGQCIFCHNGYPLRPVQNGPEPTPVFPAELPQGIDCERCHGPGSEHVRLAGTGSPVPVVRAAILNPARLPPDRQLEVCMQCHLQTTSQPLPFSVRRPERAVFSYDPREPLSSYMLFFDRSRPREDSFEVNHAAYGLRQSACFRGSSGRMVCTTCHDPHNAPRGEAAKRHYAAVCRTCHESLGAQHPTQQDCVSCHMPRRRTEDAVHVVMTDHRIARTSPVQNPLQRLEDARDQPYRGEVTLYYPAGPAADRDGLDIAVAQVRDAANLTEGVARLAAAIDRFQPSGAGYHFELAEGYRNAGRTADAVRAYELALRRAPDSTEAWLGLGKALAMSGHARQALAQLQAALPQMRPSAALLNLLGSLHEHTGNLPAAEAEFRQAITLGPELAEPYLNLGVALSKQRKLKPAEEAFREALRRAPELSAAHNNLGYLLAALQRSGEAEYHFLEALRLDPDYWFAHLSYGRLLAATGRRKQAAEHFRKAAQSPDPALRRDALSAIAP